MLVSQQEDNREAMHQLDDRIMTEDGHFGFVRYSGPVQGQQGLFYGIEWDDLSRGKHSGTYNSVQYFTTKHPNSGSFVPQNSKKIPLKPCKSFLEALEEKYLQDQPDDGIVTLGANKKIEVETVGWDKIKQKQKQLERLLIVGLSEYRIKQAYPEGDGHAKKDQKISLVCPRIQDLDLSRNLFTCPSQV
jgi:dynactin complex subunit